jgi:hypothetical protein
MRQKLLNVGPALIIILLLSVGLWATIWGVSRYWLGDA